MKPFIDSAFWSDPDIECSKAGVKLAALWLITNSQTSLLGICGASIPRFEFETGLKHEALESALQALPRAFKRFGTLVFIRNYVRHQFGTGEKLTRNNFFVALKSQFLSVKDENLREFILSEYPEFQQALQSPSQGLTKPKEGGKGKDRMEKGSAEGKPKTRDEVNAYAAEIGMAKSDVDSWFDHFEANGWRVGGKAPMKDWRAALRNGKRRAPDFASTNGTHAAPSAPSPDPAGWEKWIESKQLAYVPFARAMDTWKTAFSQA
jgi:hypothetical protein